MNRFEAWLDAAPYRVRLFALLILLTLPFWFAFIAYVELKDARYLRDCREFVTDVFAGFRRGTIR